VRREGQRTVGSKKRDKEEGERKGDRGNWDKGRAVKKGEGEWREGR